MIQIHINKACAHLCSPPELLTAGMAKAVSVQFVFSGDWDGLTKTAVFSNGRAAVDVLAAKWDGDTVMVAPEVLAVPGRYVRVGVYGTNASGVVLPTVWVTLGKVQPAAEPSGDPSTDPTLPVWAQLQEIIGDLNNLTTKAKENLVAAINEAAKTGSGGAGSIDLRTADGYIQYSNDGGATWENLIALADLKGEKGDTGATGPQGAPGKDYTLTDADKTEIAAEAAAAIAGTSVPAPASAAVGQIVKVKAVDAAGKITQTEAVDMPSGGQNWELINFIKIADNAEESIGLTINKDSSGKAFSLSRFRLIALSPIYTGETAIPAFCFAAINGRKTSSLQSEKPMGYTALQMPSKTVPTAWAWAEGYLSGNGAWELEYLAQGLISNNILSEDYVVIADKRFQNDNIKLGAATVNDRPKLYPITSVGFDQRPVYAGCMFWLYGTRI